MIVEQFGRFIIVGGVSTLIQYFVLIVAIECSRMNSTKSSTLGFAISASINYLLNRRFTFRSSSPHRVAATRFAVVALVGLVVNTSLMWILTQVGWPYLFAQVAATCCVPFWSFCGNAFWSYAMIEQLRSKGK